MPNNKGGVPMYNENPQYSATISSQLPQGSPASFGTQVAKEMAGMGDAMGKLGEKIVDYAVKRQKQEDDAYIINRENEMRQDLNALLYDPVNGLANKKGKNAFGVTMEFDDEADKLMQTALADIKNPMLQQKLQERTSQWLPSYRKGIAVHEGNERHAVGLQTVDTSIQMAINDGAKVGGAPGFNIMWYSTQRNIEDLMYHAGMSKEAAEAYIQGKLSKAFLTMGEAASKGGNTQMVRDLLEAGKDKVDGDTYTKVKAFVSVLDAQDEGTAEARKMYADQSYWHNGVYNKEKADSAAMALYGPNATRTERVLVGGGGGSYVKDSSLNGIIDAAAKKYNIDPLLVAAVARVESYGGNHTIDGNIVTSSMGALGTMQLMPDTASELGVDPYDKTQNIEGGAKYLKQLLDRFDGDVEKAVSAYNAGPGGDFNNSETRNYRKKVLEEYNNLKAQAQSTPSIDVDAAIDKAWNDYEDKSVPLPEGTNGCAHAANYFVAYFNPWSKGQIEKGGTHMSYVPQLVKDARAADGPGVEDFQEANLKKGDMIVYKAANDPEGMDHVVVYAGDGAGDYRYVGNSSGANNNQGGLVQGSDYRKMGTPSNPLTPQYIIKTSPERNAGSGGAHYEERTVSTSNPQKLAAALAENARLYRESVSAKQERIDGYVNSLLSNPAVQNAMTDAEILAEIQKLNPATEDVETILSKVRFRKGINRDKHAYERSQIQEARADAQWGRTQHQWAWQDANEEVNAYLLKMERDGTPVTSDNLSEVPGFDRMSNGNQRSMYEHMKNAETSNDAHIGWYKGENQRTFENQISSLRKSINLDDSEIPNIRQAITHANIERKQKGQDPLTPNQIVTMINEQTANWKKESSWKPKIFGGGTSEQRFSNTRSDQYVGDDGEVYDAAGNKLTWNEEHHAFE